VATVDADQVGNVRHVCVCGHEHVVHVESWRRGRYACALCLCDEYRARI
jgi:hypothetical protein